MEIELSTEEENAGPVVGKRPESTGIGFDGLDLGVETLGNSIGNRVAQVGDDILEMAFDHAGDLDHRLELRPAGPTADRPMRARHEGNPASWKVR